MKLIIASQNKGKVAEFGQALDSIGVSWISLLDYPDFPPIEENGASLEANAILKGEAVADYFGCLALADDTGLIVPALDGAPGIYSARYSGDHDDQANNKKLLKEMSGFQAADRKAYFKTVIALVWPTGRIEIVTGQAWGEILTSHQGHKGFGYDPLFYSKDMGKTFAEMTLEEKNQVSHRGRALHALVQDLPQWLEEAT